MSAVKTPKQGTVKLEAELLDKLKMPAVDLDTITVTPFQKRVYYLLNQIPAGRVTTYGALARALQTSPRAVGNALRNNVFAPRIPCHRCVASNGYINGYDGEVIQKKSFKRSDNGTINGKASQSKARGAKAQVRAANGAAEATTIPPSGINIGMKMEILKKEGVEFDANGMLLRKGKALFDGPWDVI